jgi:hypothetical protein
MKWRTVVKTECITPTLFGVYIELNNKHNKILILTSFDTC